MREKQEVEMIKHKGTTQIHREFMKKKKKPFWSKKRAQARQDLFEIPLMAKMDDLMTGKINASSNSKMHDAQKIQNNQKSRMGLMS